MNKSKAKEILSPLNLVGFSIIGILLLFVIICRIYTPLADSYSEYIFPVYGWIFSWIAFFTAFPIGDLIMIIIAIGLLVKVIRIIVGGGYGRLYNLVMLVKSILFLLVWFYLSFGINYFRSGFFERLDIREVSVSKERFTTFANSFAEQINQAYSQYAGTESSGSLNSDRVMRDIKDGYDKIYERFGLAQPWPHMRAKSSFASGLLSKVGVAGHYNPLLAEIVLNSDLDKVEYPSCLAHEMAHALGVSGEAEANYYAYLVCTSSNAPEVSYSGYLVLLRYVISDADRLMDRAEFNHFVESINPGIIEQYKKLRDEWRARYNQKMGNIQSKIYDSYLKVNKIESGVKNYSQVISLILSSE